MLVFLFIIDNPAEYISLNDMSQNNCQNAHHNLAEPNMLLPKVLVCSTKHPKTQFVFQVFILILNDLNYSLAIRELPLLLC